MTHHVRPLASDRLLAREAGAWTEDKLYWVEKYARAFMTAMAPKRAAGKWSSLSYIDLLSGPGRCILRGSGKEIDGSPLRALKMTPTFDRFYFADSSRENIEALEARIPVDRRSAVDLRVGDCNAIVNELVSALPRRGLSLTFLDPEGFEVQFETLRALARLRTDILYLFPTGIGIKRNVKQSLELRGSVMDLLWGSDDWRGLIGRERRPAGPLTREQYIRLAAPWVQAFRARVGETLGLLSDESPPLITNDRNSAMYHLLFFTRDKAGLTIWKRLKAIGPTGQRSLKVD